MTLGNGAGEAYYGSSGTVSGAINCGTGGDIVYQGAEYETINAGLGGDTFNTATGMSAIIAEKASALQNGGFDTVNNFQSGDYISVAASLQGATSFSAYQGGAIISIGLGGGNYAYVNVTGTSVANVQGHTFFA